MSNILSQIGSAVKGKIDGVNTAISAEEAARIAADGTLTSNLATEATTARAAEVANATAISTEESRATAAEGVLTTNLAAEVTDRASAVSAEASARSSADSTLQGNVDAEEASRIAADSTLTTNLAAEVTDRATAVSAEAASRASADTALQGEIDAEEVRAAAAEGVLTTNLATEVSDRQAAVSAEATTRAAAVSNLDTIKADLAGAAFTGAVSGTDLTLSGNLTVTGTTTSIETVNSQVKDSIMLLNDGAASGANNANDVGLIMERGSSEDNVALVFDEGEDKFVCYKTSATSASTDISGDDSSAELMDIKVNDVFVGSDNLGSLAEFTSALNA
jgi:trimeric autotransporter adhesin